MEIKEIEKTAYQFLEERAKKIGNNIAKNYYGNKVTYDEFRDNISKTAKAFNGMGISKNNRVGVIMPNIPETSYIQYGLNKIGAVADYIDPRTKPIVLREFVEREKIDMIVCASECYDGIIKPVEHDIHEMLKIKDIVVPSSFDSLPLGLKQLMQLKSFIKNNNSEYTLNRISYKDFIKQSEKMIPKTVDYSKEQLAIITHSSGTTGIPKPIPISNENMNALVYQHDLLDLGLEEGMKFLHILPYFAAYGSVNSEHLGSCMGMEMLEIPLFDINKLAELVLKTKTNVIIGIPSWWEIMIDSPVMKNADLSFLKIAVAGGDSLDPKTELKINEFLATHNAKCVLSKGHGMSEISGCGTYTTRDCNNLGDVGRPLPFTRYEVFDEEKGILLPFDGTREITGEAYITGPSMSSGVLDGREVIKIKTIDGERYIQSGDIITKRLDGSIHFEERADRGFTRFDGYKIHPSKIEEIINKHPAVKDCIIVNYYEEKYFGNMPIVHVVLNDDCSIEKEDVINEIIFGTMQNDKSITTRDIPIKWNFRDSIPLTLMSKKNYKTLIEEGINGNEYTIDIEEDNMRINNINIINPNSKKKIKK